MLEKLLLAASITLAANLLLGTSSQSVYQQAETMPWQQATLQRRDQPSVPSADQQRNFWDNLFQPKAPGS